MPFQDKNKESLRAEFVLRAARRESSMSALCREYSISRPTGYKWLRRFLEHGRAGLGDASRRPHRSPHQTDAAIEEQVVSLRRRRPDWGAPKLEQLLARTGVELSTSTIHRILQRRGLIRRPDVMPGQGLRFERAEPNQLWQMDFKGPLGGVAGKLTPLSVIDDHSRYVVGLREHWNTRGEGVRDSLQGVFCDYGVPQALLLDHGAPWWNAQGRGWTWLSVWLMKQGLSLRFSGIRHPQTQGKVERFHGSLKRAWRLRGPEPGAPAQAWLDAYRIEFNQVRPHAALDNATPATRWRNTARAFDPKPPEWDYGSGVDVRRLNGEGRLNLDGARYEISAALASEPVRVERLAGRALVFYRATLVKVLDLGC